MLTLYILLFPNYIRFCPMTLWQRIHRNPPIYFVLVYVRHDLIFLQCYYFNSRVNFVNQFFCNYLAPHL